MSIQILIIATLIIVCDILLTALLFLRLRKCMKLMTTNKTTIGIIESIKEYHNPKGEWLEICVCYMVNGTEYKRKFISRLGKYHNNQEVEIVYSEDNPRFSFVKDEFVHFKPDDYRLIILFVNILFLLAIIMLLNNIKRSFQNIQDLLFWLLMTISSLIWYIDEYKRANKSEISQGIVIYSNRIKNEQLVIAGYTVDTKQYETRQARLPIKHCKKIYSVGDVIEVKYMEKKPYSAIITDDIFELKKAKIVLILMSICPLIYAVLYLLFS